MDYHPAESCREADTGQTMSAVTMDLAVAETAAPDVGVDRLELAALAVSIQNDQDYSRCGEILVDIVTKQKEWTAYWAPLRAIAKSLLDAIDQKRDEKGDKLEAVRGVFEQAMERYAIERKERQEKAKAALAQSAVSYREMLNEKAKDLILSGKVADGQALREQAQLVTYTDPGEVQGPSLPGIPAVEEYNVEVTDIKAFLQEVIDGTVPLTVTVQKRPTPVIEVKESAIKVLRRMLGTAFSVKGLTVTERISYRPRARR